MRVVRVVRTTRVGASFVRVTLTDAGEDAGEDAGGAAPVDRGWDQWARVFLPRPDGSLVLPRGPATGWYSRWRDLPEGTRTEVRNETLRAVRALPGGGWEVDLDLVVHTGDDGAVTGPAGRWAATAAPGSRAGVLEQGTIVDEALPQLRGPGPAPGPLVLLADEAGLPAAEGVARSLPAGSRAVLLLEVPDARDERPLPSAADLDVRWVVRPAGAAPGRTALAVLQQVLQRGALPGRALVAAVGETEVVGAARRLVRAAGVPKERVRACPYWSSALRAG